MDAPTDVCNGSKAPVPVDTSSVPKHSNGSSSPKESVSSDPDVSQLRLSEAAGITVIIVGRRMSADTKPSLVGAIDPEPRQPHVVKPTPPNHHMRSSIFTGSDEDHAPLPTYSRSNSSSSNSSKGATPVQQPPVRVPQPPGGHCTQLL